MYVNLTRVEEVTDVQILLPAHDYCLTVMSRQDGGSPQILCVAPSEYLFLITEAEGCFSPSVRVVNILKDNKRLTLVSFIFTPIRIARSVISERWLPENAAVQQALLASDEATVQFVAHFDFLFYPALRDRTDLFKACQTAKGLELGLCQSVRLWTRESGPMFLYRETVSHKRLASPDRAGVKLTDDISVVL